MNPRSVLLLCFGGYQMANENQEQIRRVTRQSWKPGPALTFLRGLWSVVYSAIKIAFGALATVTIIAGVCLLVFIGILGDYLENDILPNADATLDTIMLDQTSYAYYFDEAGNIQVLQKLHADVKQEWVDYEDIPEDLIHAAVAIEDKRFFEHQGVDWFTTAKACISMFVGGREFGGSSITQQLIKNYFQEDDVTVQRKVLEIFRATELEKRYDKTLIMEYYLNIIYLGERCDGVKAAAATYFGKELEHLTTAECAALISITNNPSLYNPYRVTLDKSGKTGMEQNTERRTNVLWVMRNEGYITEEEYQEALSQELVLKRGIDDADRVGDCPNEDCGYHGKVGTFIKKEDGKYYCPQCGGTTAIGEDASQEVYSYFVDAVIEDVAKALAEKNGVEWNEDTKKLYIKLISKSGYHIYTTLDKEVQDQVDKIYENLEEIPTALSLQQLQSGMVIIDNRTGDIVAMAGGVGEKTTHFGFNRANGAKLQPGSSLKPLSVYAPAFQLGIFTPATVIKDLPHHYVNDRPFPYNDDRQYSYSQTILQGVISSINAIAVNTLDTIGTEYSYNFAKNKFGLTTLVDNYVNSAGTVFSDKDFSPLAMGAPTIGISVRDMAEAYATFANNGVFREARTFVKVLDSNGNLVLDNTQDSEKILSDKAVNYMNYCLDSAVDGGTGWNADIPGMDVAGKTGSTSSYRDRWFCGFTGYYTAATWCGYDIPEVINLTGDRSNPAGRLWKKVMQPIHEGKTRIPLYSKEGMVEITVCLDSGKLATSACSMDVRTAPRTANVWVYEEDVPLEDCDSHVFVDFCEECGCAANAYCKKLASVGRAKVTKRALVQMTQLDVNKISRAAKNGLYASHSIDTFIYLVDANGNPVNAYKGLNGDKNVGVSAPYLVCTRHTKQDWDAYLAAHPGHEEEPQETEPEEGTDPTQPTEEDFTFPFEQSGTGEDES